MSDNDKPVSRFTEADVITALQKAAEILGVGGAMGLLAQYGNVESITRLHPHDYEKVILACGRVADGMPPGETVH
jgi:hypothetical protein